MSNGGNGGIGSATGHPAPNAGTTGSAPTFDVGRKKKRRRGQRPHAYLKMRVSKVAAFEAGVKHAFDWKRTALIAGASGTGILAIYDLLRTRGYEEDVKTVQHAITSGKLVDSRAFVKKIDPKISVAWTESDIRRLLAREPSIPNWQASSFAKSIADQLAQGRNAFALPGERGASIFAPQRCSAQVLAHEVGHILDFRAKGLNISKQGPYSGGLMSVFWKPSYEESTMTPEREAWRRAPGRKRSTKLEEAALGSYDKAFHSTRGVLSGTTAVILGASLMKAAQSMTAGEFDRDVSAPGVTGRDFAFHRPEERVDRRSYSKGRGVPEWLHVLKGRKPPTDTGRRDTSADNQFEVPYARV